MKLGLHLSIQGPISKVVERAVEKECNTFQMFSRNPRGWRSKPLVPCEVEDFKRKLRKSKIFPVFIHTPYLLNLASPKKDVYNRSTQALEEELHRAGELEASYVVTHLGSHLGYGKGAGAKRIVNAINDVLSIVENDVVLLLENTAGTRNSMGSSFEDIRRILTRIRLKERVGVCFDTCHAFAAGYDLVTKDALHYTLSRFERIVGFNQLKLVHLNDCKAGLGSRLDRHEHIGLGKIGEKGFENILNSRLKNLPLILETPIDNRRSDLENLSKVRELAR
jgi:deoxyribonuclease-4